MKTLLVATLAAIAALPAAETDPQTPNPGNDRPTVRDPSLDDRKDLDRTDRPTAADQGNSPADVEMTRKIRQALVNDDSLSVAAQNIVVVTRDGVVHLSGDVPENEHQRILTVIAGIPGSRSVMDHINERNQAGQQDRDQLAHRDADTGPDADLIRRARKIWAEDQRIANSSGNIDLQSRDGVIVVTGTVPDEATRKRVIDQLGTVADGRRIDDRLSIGAPAAPGERSDQADRGKQGNSGATDTTPAPLPHDPARESRQPMQPGDPAGSQRQVK